MKILLLVGILNFQVFPGISVQLAELVNNNEKPLISLRIDGKDETVVHYKTYYYACPTANSSFKAEIALSSQISELKVSPVRLGITGQTNTNATSFNLPGPGYYVVRINDSLRLFILADPPEVLPVENVVRVTDLGVDPASQIVQTVLLQKIINDYSGKNRTILFPPGVYLSGSLAIPSNTRIYLQRGAILKASGDLSDLSFNDDIKPRSFIRIKDAANVSIDGYGIIDGNGRYLRDKYGDDARMRLILVLNSGKVDIRRIIVRDPGSWNTHILYSDNVTISNLKMMNDINLSNTDGFDPDGSRNVLIDNCFAYCSDDNVAVKSTGSSGYLRNSENITVRGCVFLTKKSSLKVGTESLSEEMKDITFENNDVIEADRGMSLYCSDGAVFSKISFINNRFEDNYPDAKRCGMNFTITKRNPDSRAGVMKDILVQDCTFLHSFPRPSEIMGLDPSHTIQVTFKNLRTGGKQGTDKASAVIGKSEFTDLTFK